jgi:hypothetical protein
MLLCSQSIHSDNPSRPLSSWVRIKSHKPTFFGISGNQMIFDAVFIGGEGKIGLPLSILLSSRGVNTTTGPNIRGTTPRLIFS